MKTRTEKVYPKPGKIVIDPESKRQIPAEGKVVTWTSYWVRRMTDGDITLEPMKKEKPKKKAEKKFKDEKLKEPDVKEENETLKPQENEK